MKFYLKTFGCQMNVADSDLMASHLGSRGLVSTDDIASSDLIIVNTCSVRDHAEHRALSFIGRLAPLKKKNPVLKILVTGCTAQKEGDKLRKNFPIVDAVIGAMDIEHFPEIFEELFSIGNGSALQASPPVSKISTFVTIMRGCENFCSYCIVPLVRGKEKSRPAAEILDEIKALTAKGVKEVTLLGQNVNSYLDAGLDFPGLLSKVNDVPGIERIRFMTSHPKDLSERLIEAMASLPKVCEHLHLPLQSGSDRILQLMNRKYSAADYLRLIEKLRAKIPNISVTTDILVGFPGETELDFNETLKVIETVDFDFLFAFKFQPRPGTPALSMPGQVAQAVEEERHQRVLEMLDSIVSRKNAKLMGSVQEVLIDHGREGNYSGRTRTNKKVFVDSAQDLTGQIVNVVINAAKRNSFSGVIDAKCHA